MCQQYRNVSRYEYIQIVFGDWYYMVRMINIFLNDVIVEGKNGVSGWHFYRLVKTTFIILQVLSISLFIVVVVVLLLLLLLVVEGGGGGGGGRWRGAAAAAAAGAGAAAAVAVVVVVVVCRITSRTPSQ